MFRCVVVCEFVLLLCALLALVGVCLFIWLFRLWFESCGLVLVLLCCLLDW